MILADIWTQLAIGVGTGLITLAIGTILGSWRQSRKDHAKLIREVADRYVADRRARKDEDSPANRLGSMQRAGLALLDGDEDVRKFSEIAVRRGCTDPFHESDLDQFLVKDGLTKFLAAASARGISLDDDLTLYETLVTAIEETHSKPKRNE